jgi:hypothetical protein
VSDYVTILIISGVRRVVSTGLITTSLGIVLGKDFTDIARFSDTVACIRAHLEPHEILTSRPHVKVVFYH